MKFTTFMATAVLGLSLSVRAMQIPSDPRGQIWPRPDSDKIEKAAIEEISAGDKKFQCMHRGECIVFKEGANTLDKLFDIASAANAANPHAVALDATQEWREWWAFEEPNDSFDSSENAKRFLQYASERRSGQIPDLLERVFFEFEMVNVFGRKVRMYGLKCDDPVLEESSQLEDEAKILRDKAEDLRREYSDSICEHVDFGRAPRDTVYGMALLAVKCGDRKGQLEGIVGEWQEWWDKLHKPNPYDTRNAADRLLAYAIDRRTGVIQRDGVIEEFEKRIASKYYSLVGR